MRKLLFTVLAVLSGTFAFADGVILSRYDAESPDIYYYKSSKGKAEGRFVDVSPMFFVYPDIQYDIENAHNLLQKSGLEELILEYGGSAALVRPLVPICV